MCELSHIVGWDSSSIAKSEVWDLHTSNLQCVLQKETLHQSTTAVLLDQRKRSPVDSRRVLWSEGPEDLTSTCATEVGVSARNPDVTAAAIVDESELLASCQLSMYTV